MLGRKLAELTATSERFTGRDGEHPTAIASLSLFRFSAPTDPVMRLLLLLDTPQDIGALAPLVLREITYRLLMGEQGGRLRRIAAADGREQQNATAIRWAGWE